LIVILSEAKNLGLLVHETLHFVQGDTYEIFLASYYVHSIGRPDYSRDYVQGQRPIDK